MNKKRQKDIIEVIGIVITLMMVNGCADIGHEYYEIDDNVAGQASVQLQTGGVTSTSTGGRNTVVSTGGKTQQVTTTVSTGGKPTIVGTTPSSGYLNSTGGVIITPPINSTNTLTYCKIINNDILQDITCSSSSQCIKICNNFISCSVWQTITICVENFTTVYKSKICSNINNTCQCNNGDNKFFSC